MNNGPEASVFCEAACTCPPKGVISSVTATEIIEEIKRLPRQEQVKVAEFARQAVEISLLTPEELGELAHRMVETSDPAEADRLEQEIVRGFYGEKPHA